jgi:capsular exopolysaccharide synthesis family protein
VEAQAAPEFDLRRYARGLRQRKWTIVAVVVLAVATAVTISVLQTPRYVARAEVVLEPRSGDALFNSSTPPQTDPQVSVDTEIQVIKSPPVQAAVVARIGPASKVGASRVGQTLVISVQGSATGAHRAADVANAYAAAYLDLSKSQEANSLLAAARQLQDQITTLQTQIDQLDTEAATASSSQKSDLAAGRAPLLSQRDAFLQRLSELRVDASLASGGAHLVALATTPGSPVQPAPVRNTILALFAGLLFGIGAACFLEYLDDRIRTEEDLERMTTLPVLAGIPSFPHQRKDHLPELALDQGRGTPAAEAFRTLRTAIQLLGIAKPLTVIQFTSPTPGDGKTTTVANLATLVADAGHTVVIMDCDLRRPLLDQVFGVANRAGLTSVLSQQVALADATQTVPRYEGLSILTSGATAPNPSELLSLTRTSEVIFQLQSRFDMVLLDSPPLLPVTDSVVLSEWVDAVVVVVTAGVTSRRVHPSSGWC